jgi:hypothetical protein
MLGQRVVVDGFGCGFVLLAGLDGVQMVLADLMLRVLTDLLDDVFGQRPDVGLAGDVPRVLDDASEHGLSCVWVELLPHALPTFQMPQGPSGHQEMSNDWGIRSIDLEFFELAL